MDRQKIDALAKKIWNYHHMNHALKKSDCILILGSHDLRVAERGAQLFLEGWAPIIIFSGGVAHAGDLLNTAWNMPEAEKFAQIAVKMGVPEENILIENKATNTGENIEFTRRLLREKKFDPKSFIVVQKPYMERRAYATFKKRWPEKDIIIMSPKIRFEDYPNEEITKDDLINIMVGDLQRIKIYAEKGFQIPQEIPKDVWNAFEELVNAGYTKHLISD
jgi:uncharacterized SAM-binding protein YcdF (DUF218 family)